MVFLDEREDFLRFFQRSREDQAVRRAANLKRRMESHWFIQAEAVGFEEALAFRHKIPINHQAVIPIHFQYARFNYVRSDMQARPRCRQIGKIQLAHCLIGTMATEFERFSERASAIIGMRTQ